MTLKELEEQNQKLYEDILPGNYETSYKWDDSIVVDKETELASMLTDVSANILRPEIYLAKKYGVTEEEALKMMPQLEESAMSPYNGLEE